MRPATRQWAPWLPRAPFRTAWTKVSLTSLEVILRVVASIYTGTVRAYDMVKMLQRDGSPTPLGEAIAAYGRIFKSLHVLTYLDDEVYRRDIKGIRNLQEGRHALAEK